MTYCNFAHTIIEQSQEYPDKFAMRDGVEDLTYGQLITRIQQIAQGLRSFKLTPGQHVIIVMEDCIDWPCVFLGCLYNGLVPLPLSTEVGQELFCKIADFIEGRLIIANDRIAEKLTLVENLNIPLLTRSAVKKMFDQPVGKGNPIMVHPDSPAFMQISSGSTGMPKVAMHRHQAFYEILKSVPEVTYGMNQDSIMFSTAKMSWAMGLHNSLTHTFGLGATSIVIPGAPAPSVIFEYAHKFKPTIITSSPTIIKKFLNSPLKFTLPDSVVHFHSSGDDLAGTIYDQFFDQFGMRLTTAIGMMECCQTYAALVAPIHEKGTVGRPLPGVECKILNLEGNNCIIDEIGELYVKSPANAMYYYKNYDKSQDTFCGAWVKTRDLVYLTKQGNMAFAGRVDDVFKVNGFLVSPVGLEAEILSTNQVEQVTVVGVEHSKSNFEIHAFIIPKGEFNLEQFKNTLAAKLFSHQMPKQIHIVDNLPETVTNKRDRKATLKHLEISI